MLGRNRGSAEEGLVDGVVLLPRVLEPSARDDMEVRLSGCHERRMGRSLHDRWPYRRSHCRHDHHWLARVKPREAWCASDRGHSLSALRGCNRRP